LAGFVRQTLPPNPVETYETPIRYSHFGFALVHNFTDSESGHIYL
jgi:hypothetical protein